jgi:argonaute-like protein implicated in RNA metabolism and viral defense
MGMNTKVIRMLSKGVQMRSKVLENGKTEYIIERKCRNSGEWEVIAKSLRIERALVKKHNAWLAQLHFLNLTSKLLHRRKYGKYKVLGIQVN